MFLAETTNFCFVAVIAWHAGLVRIRRLPARSAIWLSAPLKIPVWEQRTKYVALEEVFSQLTIRPTGA